LNKVDMMKHWHAMYTKPHMERQVAGLLREMGLDVYVPTVRRKRRRRDRPDRLVYFPCYLFARVDFEVTPRSSVDWLPGIRHVVCAGDRPAVVADELVQLIRHRLEGIEEIGYGNLKQGDRVRITEGPLRELEAVFDQAMSAADRVRVLLEVMGRMTPVVLDVTQVKRI
jgi:transcription antitermination factor NusG